MRQQVIRRSHVIEPQTCRYGQIASHPPLVGYVGAYPPGSHVYRRVPLRRLAAVGVAKQERRKVEAAFIGRESQGPSSQIGRTAVHSRVDIQQPGLNGMLSMDYGQIV